MTDAEREDFDARLKTIEADLQRLREDMQTADAMGTAPARSELSTAKGAVGRARAELGGGYRATEETRRAAEQLIKGSPHASPTGTRTIRRHKPKVDERRAQGLPGAADKKR